MKKLTAITILIFAFCTGANADVWTWVDIKGGIHFVDTVIPIYTWLDEYGRVYFTDKPGHENATRVKLLWHSSGSLAETTADEIQEDTGSDPYPGETDEERLDREMAEAYYCKQSSEIHETYINAPRLFRTTEDGQREYLSDEEAATTIAESEAKVKEWCN